MTGIVFEPATPENSAEVREFMLNYFYAFEPTNLAYIYGKEPATEDVDFSIKFLDVGLGVKAVTDDGQMVGLSLGYIGDEDDAVALRETADRSSDRKFSDIMRFLAFVQNGSNIRERYGINAVYEIQLVAVHTDFRGKSIATGLIRSQIQIAKERGFEGVYVDCSSIYTAKIMEKLGFECVHEIDFADYRTEKGERIFKPADEIHTGLKSYFKRI
ncbi:arylalkylamine N-acetyltransferase 1-like [Topomyia yanbarensis]|uniref:arylalkylamine N-acetyltransferase 1-like n=1 Tax=Topomyia yanbarensis TaxID=2498891 RepID=UPI00273CD8B0|nr:arylalkylamine N-acetyltransferase 1-like [Topomyia yanbarensis]